MQTIIRQLIDKGQDYGLVIKPETPPSPQTVRDLICWEWSEEHESIERQNAFDITVQLNAFNGILAKPVPLKKLNMKRPVGAIKKGAGLRYSQGWVTIWCKWLENNGLLTQKILNEQIAFCGSAGEWDLMLLFEQILTEKTNLTFWDIGWASYCDDDLEEAYFDTAWMPLHNYEILDDAAPLLELMHCCQHGSNFHTDLPEVFYHVLDECNEMQQGADYQKMFRAILVEERFDLLNEQWQKLLNFLKDYEHSIAFCDHNETMIELCSVSDIDFLFTEGRSVSDMLDITTPMLDRCNSDPGAFWIEFKNMLDKAWLKEPELCEIWNAKD